MRSFRFPVRLCRSLAARLLLACCLAGLAAGPLLAQSTFGTILGTVRDSTGALLPGAQVVLSNNGTAAVHTAVTDAAGSYAFRNIDVATYTLALSAPGFQQEALPPVVLTARQTRRMDATLKPGADSPTVVVIDDPVPVITTDVSNLAATKVGEELVELPVAIYSRSTGSTSPISTLTTEAGVQTDDSGNLAVMGTTAALLYLNLQDASGNGVGRFGYAPVGGLAGPGTANFSFSLMKNLSIAEKSKFQLGLEAANVLNHRNYEPPNMQVDSPGFGAITALQTAEGAGPRSLQLYGRITF